VQPLSQAGIVEGAAGEFVLPPTPCDRLHGTPRPPGD
jgi:hypothetical protein